MPSPGDGSHQSDALQAAALAAFGHKERFPQPGGLAVVAEEGDASARPELVDTGTPGRLRETSSLSTQDILWPTQSLGGSILHRQQSAGGSVLSLPASSGPSPIASQVDSLTVHPETRLSVLDAQLGADRYLHVFAAIVTDSDAMLILSVSAAALHRACALVVAAVPSRLCTPPQRTAWARRRLPMRRSRRVPAR